MVNVILPFARRVVRFIGRAAFAGVLLGLRCSSPAQTPPAPEGFPLPAGVREIVSAPASFERFAATLRPWIEARLKASPPGPELKLLLAMRVHLALHAGDDRAALETAERLRDLQLNETERAFSGVMTVATVRARREGGTDPRAPRYADALQRALAAELQRLPRTPAMRAVLEKQRARLASMTAPLLLAAAEKLAAQCDASHRCSLEQADEIVRLGHRFTALVPVREAILAAFEAELQRR